MSLGSQTLLPGGASSLRFSEVVNKPAGALLAQGDLPPAPVGQEPVEVESVRALSTLEARALIEGEDARRVLPKVPLDAAGVMRTRHHAIARLMACGRKPAEIARIVGASPASIALLERSPAFQALLLEYMAMMDKEAVGAFEKLKVLNSFGLDELISRLADPAEAAKLKATEVLEVVKVSSDRTGLGPTSKSVTLNGRITPADIRAMKEAQSAERLLEAEPAEWVEISGDSEAAGDAGYLQPEGESAAEAGHGVRAESGKGVSTTDDLSNLLPALDTLFGQGR